MKILLAMDFDECMVNQHSSKIFTKAFLKRYNINLENDFGYSKNSLETLLSSYIGFTERQLAEIAESVIPQITWRKDSEEFLSEITKLENVVPIFISSGSEFFIEQFLKNYNIKIPVIGCANIFNDSKAVGIKRLVTDEKKGEIVKSLITQHKPDFTITLGHSKGDIELVKNGTKGYRFCLPDCEEITEVADHQIEKFREILSSIKF